MPPWKWRLVCAFEGVLRLILPMLPARASQASPAQPKTILVVEYWNLGDLAILVPFLKNLRAGFPRAKISLLVDEGLKTFLEEQELLDEFIPVRVPWAQHCSRSTTYNPLSLHCISFTHS